MLRAAAKRGQELPAALLVQTRQYFAPISVDFTDGISTPKTGASGGGILAEWSATKAATEQTIRLLQTYKEIGDEKEEPYLKYHNPRTFEDLDKPIPNFKKFGLKAGEVPKFFDGVLSKRASESVQVKGLWWDQRREAAAAAVADKASKPLPTLPVPTWEWSKPVGLDGLKGVTDAYFKALEPPRKLKVPELPASVTNGLTALGASVGKDGSDALKAALDRALADKVVVEEGGKPLPGFKFTSSAQVAALLATRRAQVHARFVKMWAKRVLAQPEQALVPLKERDALLASKFTDVSDKYNSLIELVGRGEATYGEKLAADPATDGFFLRRSKAEIADMFPPSEEEKEAVALAKQLDDRGYALSKLLGPLLTAEGSKDILASEEAAAINEHLYTPDRYMYQEGQKLAARYAEEEAELADKLKALYGSTDGLLAAQRSPLTPSQAVAQHKLAAAAAVKAIEADKAAAAGHPYLEYALGKRAAFVADASNLVFEEVLYPELQAERFAIEMAELDAKEKQLDEAEEEELWLLTLAQQSRHMQQHFEFDLPQAAYAHMDPLLYKKLDWELTQGMDLLHHEAFLAADCEQGEYVRDQMGLENLSHHLLPLLRYRRKKWRQLVGYYPPELTALPVKTTPVA